MNRIIEEVRDTIGNSSKGINEYFIFKDTVTGVKYLFIAGALTPLLDSNGKPYKEVKETPKVKENN